MDKAKANTAACENNPRGAACENNPRGAACDIVEYAEGLDDKTIREDMEKMTVGKQPGYTRASMDGVLEASQKLKPE